MKYVGKIMAYNLKFSKKRKYILLENIKVLFHFYKINSTSIRLYDTTKCLILLVIIIFLISK